MELYTAAVQRWTYTFLSSCCYTATVCTIAASLHEGLLAIESLLWSLLESMLESLLERAALWEE